MNGQTEPVGVAVVCNPEGADAAAMQALLQAQDILHAHWYAPRDVHDVDRAVCARSVQRIIFPHLSNLLDAVWDETIAFERWLDAGTRVEFVHPSETASETHVQLVCESWRRWRRRLRRRRAVAGAVLSLAALAAAFALLAVLR